MSDAPWLTIIGIGEDGVAGLSATSQAALAKAEVIMAPARHLALVPAGIAERITWPVPFAKGLPVLQGLKGRRVVVLASGDPFWFGAGSVIARHLDPSDWHALPGVSCFALAAAHMGWALDDTLCRGLHAAPMTRLRRDLAQGSQIIATLRDGAAVAEIAAYLRTQGFGASTLVVLEHLGGPSERATRMSADHLTGAFYHPVCVAIAVAGDDDAAALSVASGQIDETFDHDGQITKRPVRAITLSTLAPRPGEHLWDIGGGSGSIALEWLLSHPRMTATTIERRADRAAQIRNNAAELGVEHRLGVVEGTAPDAFIDMPAPDAVFVGGGMSDHLLDAVLKLKAPRLVVNAVTLEGEALLARYQAQHGGELMRIALSHTKPLGQKRGWSASYPVVQWSLNR